MSFLLTFIAAFAFQEPLPADTCNPLDKNARALVQMIRSGDRAALRNYVPHANYDDGDWTRLEAFVFGPNGDFPALADIAVEPESLCQITVVQALIEPGQALDPDGNQPSLVTLYLIQRDHLEAVLSSGFEDGYMEHWFACEFVRRNGRLEAPAPVGDLHPPFCHFETGGPVHDYG